MSTQERRVGRSAVEELGHDAWFARPAAAPGARNDLAERLEQGAVLSFPQLAFALQPGELQLLHVSNADGQAKNISLRWPKDGSGPHLRGATGTAEHLAAMRAMTARFAEHAAALATHLFPAYAAHLRRGNTSFRPFPIAGRRTSWRQDDTRLHVDAFPSNPARGQRLLRVFTNVNPLGQPRIWRTGECFEDFARRFLPQVGRPLPGAARLLHALNITKARRTEYDHVMLRLHDLAKADLRYQRDAPQQLWGFAPGTTWICFSDQVLHAAMSGQYLLEQTFLLDPQALLRPESSPLHVLERLLRRRLLEERAADDGGQDLAPAAFATDQSHWADPAHTRS